MEESRFSPITVILNTFFICIVVYFLEYRFFPQIGSVFGIAIITRIFIIFAIAVALKLINSSWKNIGYVVKAKYILGGIIKPIIILAVCTLITLLLIKLIVKSQGATLSFGVKFNSSLPISVISVIISAITSETLLRGFILQTANSRLRFYAANTINVFLTIVWQSAIYVFDVILNGESAETLLKTFIFICLIYGVAAIRKSLYTRATGTIWDCLTDCFISLLIINKLRLDIILPANFTPTNTIGNLVSFMSSNAMTSTYATIILLSVINILALIATIAYCSILKKKARKKYCSILLEQQEKDM